MTAFRIVIVSIRRRCRGAFSSSNGLCALRTLWAPTIILLSNVFFFRATAIDKVYEVVSVQIVEQLIGH